MKLNRTDVNLDRTARNKENENWNTIEGSVRKMSDDFNNTTQKLEDDFNNVVESISDQVVEKLVDTSKLDWREPVDTIEDLPSADPIGTVRQVREATSDGVSMMYRKYEDGWKVVQEYDATAINEVDSRLTAQLLEVERLQDKTALFDKLGSGKEKLPFPAGFTWADAPINIYSSPNGKVTTDFDVSKYQHKGTGKTYYVDVNNGHNNNNGLTKETAYKSLWKALEQTDGDTILVAGGYYTRADTMYIIAVNRSISIKALNGDKPIISISDDNLSWTKVSDTNNVYQTTRSATGGVYDRRYIDEYGDYHKLKQKDSIAEVNSESGTWFTNGNTVYVHTPNSRQPDNDIRLMLNLQNLFITGNAGVVYVEGIHFEGGKVPIRSESFTNPLSSAFYAKNCSFKYGIESNGVMLWGIGKVYLQSCEVAHSRYDGFNYHIQNGVVPDVIEVDCIGRHNGLDDSANQHNGSTMHDGGRIIRVNGEYHHNKGPNVIDVNDGGESWCVGTLAHSSQATRGTMSNSDFKNGNVGASEMWLDLCVSYGSDYSLVTTGEGSKTYIDTNLMLSKVYNDPGTDLVS